ncbi:MAG: Hsp20/alpha crystallin family protein, partial [Alcaligenes aquatilis]
MANNLTRFNPFGDLTGTETWRDFEDIFRRVPVVGSLAGNTPPSIRLDVNESEQAYQVSAEVPGIKKEDVHVSVEGNVVTIRVESRREQEE